MSKEHQTYIMSLRKKHISVMDMTPYVMQQFKLSSDKARKILVTYILTTNK